MSFIAETVSRAKPYIGELSDEHVRFFHSFYSLPADAANSATISSGHGEFQSIRCLLKPLVLVRSPPSFRIAQD